MTSAWICDRLSLGSPGLQRNLVGQASGPAFARNHWLARLTGAAKGENLQVTPALERLRQACMSEDLLIPVQRRTEYNPEPALSPAACYRNEWLSGISQQIDYYRARADEYDQWFLRQGRYDRGPASNRC